MRNLIFLIPLVLPLASAQAQVVEFECPKFYPSQDTALAEVPYQHKGKGIIKRRELYNVALFWGDSSGIMELAPAFDKKVKDGTDVGFLPPTWLVCYYGNVSWWEEVNADKMAEKGQIKEGCILQIRDRVQGTAGYKLVCK